MRANLNSQMKDGVTPAYVAAGRGHVEVIKALASHEADLNTPNNDGATPAYIAAQKVVST